MNVTDGLYVARMPSVFQRPSVAMPGVSAGTRARTSGFDMSVPPSSVHQTIAREAPRAIVQKYFTPSST